MIAIDNKIGKIDASKTYHAIDAGDQVTISQNLEKLDDKIGDLKLTGDYTITKDQKTATVLYANNEKAFSITVEGLGDGSGGTSYEAGNGIDISSDKISVKIDGSDLTSSDKGLAVKKDGKVESGNTGLVTGGTVYDALQAMDNQTVKLSNDINKVGAGAAALAALRPEAFNPEDKWSFAVGYGHYKNANAGALGVFYKPNSDTTVSFGGTIGHDDSMMNMGVSFKLGNKGKKAGTYRSAVDLVKRIDALEANMVREMKRNDSQDSLIATQAKEIRSLGKRMAQLEADNARLQQQIANLLSDMGVAIR